MSSSGVSFLGPGYSLVPPFTVKRAGAQQKDRENTGVWWNGRDARQGATLRPPHPNHTSRWYLPSAAMALSLARASASVRPPSSRISRRISSSTAGAMPAASPHT